MEIIDADGHVNEIADQEAIAKYLPAGNRSSSIFPVLDHLHFHYLRPSGNRPGLAKPCAFSRSMPRPRMRAGACSTWGAKYQRVSFHL